jgi:integration host factor subunit beta
VTKSDLVDLIAERASITRVKAEALVCTVFDSMILALKKDERVEIRGFGTFEMRHYSKYNGHNPKTGEPVEVHEKRLPFFKVGKQLKIQLNGKTSDSSAG